MPLPYKDSRDMCRGSAATAREARVAQLPPPPGGATLWTVVALLSRLADRHVERGADRFRNKRVVGVRDGRGVAGRGVAGRAIWRVAVLRWRRKHMAHVAVLERTLKLGRFGR